MNVWEKRDDETPAAYAAFCVYRALGADRTLNAAHDAHKGRQEGVKRASGIFYRWSKTFDWVERATAYDAHIEAQARMEQDAIRVAERRAEIEAYRKRTVRVSASSAEVGLSLVAKAAERLRNVKAEEISIESLPGFIRVGVAAMQMGLNAESEALAVKHSPEMMADGESDTPSRS